MRGILTGNSYESLSQELLISLRALRYRIKKMYDAAVVAYRIELEQQLGRYIMNLEQRVAPQAEQA